MSLFYTLPKPNLSEISDKKMVEALSGKKSAEIFDFIKRMSSSEYLYWDTLQYKEPSPEGVPKELLWKIVKFFRKSRIKTSIATAKGEYFGWSRLDYFEEFFHELDLHTGGELFVEQGDIYRANKQKLITRGTMEEAIASSQLEGAATSRRLAKKMLREGKKPSTPSEQMIVNNYHSMKKIEEEYKDCEMNMDLLLELHSLITKDTVDSEGEKPRMRKSGESIDVVDDGTGIIYHRGPNVAFVQKHLKKLIAFANDSQKDDTFIHPIIKAIMLHFWMGYLHPFTDGNGRMARLLFYWYLLRKEYWAFAYLPISRAIKKSPKQYYMAYVYSEQDENDMTYFLDYHIKKIKVAVEDFKKYLRAMEEENVNMNRRCVEKHSLNMRQVQLLRYLYGNMNERTTLTAHMSVNQVTKMTAGRDLKDLVKKGFLTSKKQGKHVYYSGTKKVKELFEYSEK